MSEQDPEIRRLVDEARAYVGARRPPDLTAPVMRRIREAGVAPPRINTLRRLEDLFWTPRDVRLRWRPAYVVVAAVVLLLGIMLLPYGFRAAKGNPQLFVQFRLEASDATDVRLAGSFTNWEPRYELHQVAPGNWTVTVPLSAGVHDYVFVVNGQRWIPDPYASRIDDGFGGVNSRISLVAPDAPRL